MGHVINVIAACFIRSINNVELLLNKAIRWHCIWAFIKSFGAGSSAHVLIASSTAPVLLPFGIRRNTFGAAGQTEVPTALLFSNVGVEAGQVAFILALVGVFASIWSDASRNSGPDMFAESHNI